LENEQNSEKIFSRFNPLKTHKADKQLGTIRLTDHDPTCSAGGDRPATKLDREMGATPEMVRAGVAVFRLGWDFDDAKEAVESIYDAMVSIIKKDPRAMNANESEQRRDALLLRLLKTPPEPRAGRKRPRAKSDKQASRTHVSESSDGKRGPSA
jgi:hypothetical protein